MSGVAGDLHVMWIEDVLGWISRKAGTGTLHVRKRSTHKRLLFNAGLLDATHSNDPREMLGQFLIRDGAISEQQLFEALLEQEKERRLLGGILMAQGLIDAERLARSLRACAEETAYDVFLWPDGQFEYEAGEPGGDALVELRIDIAPILEEGLWRRGEWKRMRRLLPSLDVRFRVPGDALDQADPADRGVLELARAGHSLARISLETRRSPFATAAHLLALRDQGLLAVETPVQDDAATDAVAAIQRSLAAAAERMAEGRHDAAMAAYENALALDPLNQEAKKGLVAVSEARQRHRVGSRVPLDKVPVLAVGSMALTQHSFDPQEGFLLSRVNGEWNVRSILKLCPLPEDRALEILARLLDRRVITLL